MLLPPHVGGGLIWGTERASGTVVVAACFVVWVVCWVIVMSKTLLGVFLWGCLEEATIVGCTSDWCSFIYGTDMWAVFGYMIGTCFIRS